MAFAFESSETFAVAFKCVDVQLLTSLVGTTKAVQIHGSIFITKLVDKNVLLGLNFVVTHIDSNNTLIVAHHIILIYVLFQVLRQMSELELFCCCTDSVELSPC